MDEKNILIEILDMDCIVDENGSEVPVEISAYVETWFDVEGKYGIVLDDELEECADTYVMWKEGEPLLVEVHVWGYASPREEWFEYNPTAEEEAIIIKKIFEEVEQ